MSEARFAQTERKRDVRESNFIAAKAVADVIRTSLGPRGMDKMIVSPTDEVTISNDGATIMSRMGISHPAAKMLVDLSRAQDVEAGDGTTSVVVLCGSLLNASQELLRRGLPATQVAEGFLRTSRVAMQLLRAMAVPVDLADRASLLRLATTSLSSKVVSQYSGVLAPIAVDAVLRIINPEDKACSVDLGDIRVVKKLGGTIEETELVDGLVFDKRASHSAGGPSTVKGAKIALVQFQLSPPKTNMDNSVVISDYTQMDRILKQEREYILRQVKVIKATGCNVLLVQKSILRDAVSELALQYLAKLKILVVKDIERSDIEFICKTVGCKPIASIDFFTADKLGSAQLVEEVTTSEGGKLIKITGVPHVGRTVSVLCRGSNALVLDEAERSIHDALCVVRALVRERFLLPGGGAPEIELALQLEKHAKTLPGMEQMCARAFAEALEVIPYTLAENAGLHPIQIVVELRNRHALGEKTAGINVRSGAISDILEEQVVQPLLVTMSAIKLATETVSLLLKVDDIVRTR